MSLCRPGLVGPKIAFSVEETAVSWSENCIFSKMDQLTPTIPHFKSSLNTKETMNLERENNHDWIP